MGHPWNVNRILVLAGAAVCLAAVLIFLGTGAPAEQAIPLVPGIVVGLVLAAYAPAWMYLVAGIATAAFPLLVIAVFGAYQAIIHPVSGVEGAAITMLGLGAVLALVGGVAGFVQARGKTAPPPRDLLRAPQGLAGVLLVALTAGLLLSGTWATADSRLVATAPASLIVPDETIRMSTTGAAFAPMEVKIPVGKLVALHIVNDDAMVHTFTYHVDGVERNSIIPANSEMDLHFKFDRPTTIHFWCAPHSGGAADDGSSGGMVGDIVVQ